jgi:hypothetical protein
MRIWRRRANENVRSNAFRRRALEMKMFVVTPSGVGRWNGENVSVNPQRCANANVSRLKAKLQTFAKGRLQQ